MNKTSFDNSMRHGKKLKAAENSVRLHEKALERIPGGVNSPVRAFGAVGGNPIYIQQARGARLMTVDGDELIDFCCSWGPLILGHAHPKVIEAVCDAAAKGTSFGTSTSGEVELAELLCEQIQYLDMVRLVNSGTEAAMTALRLARASTGRDKILKFEGCYHGHADYLLVAAGSGLSGVGESTSAGIPEALTNDVLVAPYNDLAAAQRLVHEFKDEVAAIIVEPVAGNMGLVPPAAGFLQGLRQLADSADALLIFDEVITGFRFAPTSYGTLCGVEPDLTCLGKIIGGGLPIGAVGGSRAVMELLAPLGKVYQAGTLSGNPVAVAAGLATLRTLMAENPYPRMLEMAEKISRAVSSLGNVGGNIPITCSQAGSAFTIFFGRGPVKDKRAADCSDSQAFANYFHVMLEEGIYLPPSQYETCFLSAAHSEDDIDMFVDLLEKI